MVHQLDLTLILSCEHIPVEASLNEYSSIGEQLILVSKSDEGRDAVERNCAVVPWRAETGRVAALNEAISRAECAHILWLEAGESIAEIPELTADGYHAGHIFDTESELLLNRQIRLFPNTLSLAFKGFEIPDIFEAAQRLSWQPSDHPVAIKRSAPLFTIEAIQREVECGTRSPMYNFWEGVLATENEKFVRGIACFKKALHAQGLARWNELAALNTLAHNYMETHQLSKARETAAQSLDKSRKQRAPYLSLYRYYNFEGALTKAYRILQCYTEVAAVETSANWDVCLPKTEAVFLMAELALQQGQHQKAYHHYEQFYQLNSGQVSGEVLEKLFLYAVELQERGKAIQYFEALFSGRDELEECQTARIREALALFTDKGWYDYAGQIYQKLVAGRPNDDALRNGLIRTLVKNDEISKARALI